MIWLSSFLLLAFTLLPTTHTQQCSSAWDNFKIASATETLLEVNKASGVVQVKDLMINNVNVLSTLQSLQQTIADLQGKLTMAETKIALLEMAPSNVASFVHWGDQACPVGTTRVFPGFAATTRDSSGITDFLCLPTMLDGVTGSKKKHTTAEFLLLNKKNCLSVSSLVQLLHATATTMRKCHKWSFARI